MDEKEPVGTGPCTKHFTGENCEFYPELAVRKYFRPSCTDENGSFCECMWYCWNKKDVFESLNNALKDYQVTKILEFFKLFLEASKFRIFNV